MKERCGGQKRQSTTSTKQEATMKSKAAVCSICKQVAKPILDDLHFITSCCHVFHYSCLTACFADRPRKPNLVSRCLLCPFCLQSFASFRCVKRLLFASPGGPDISDDDDDEECEAERMRELEQKLSSYASLFHDGEVRVNKFTSKISSRKRKAEKAKARVTAFEEEKTQLVMSLHAKAEELSGKVLESSKLQKTVLEMDKELAVLKMLVDLDLPGEEMTEIAFGLIHKMSHEDLIYVLKRSLAHHMREFKDLKFQTNLIAKEECRSHKESVKAKQKIHMLKTRVEELEKNTPSALMVEEFKKAKTLLFEDKVNYGKGKGKQENTRSINSKE